MENGSADGTINVIYANALDSSNGRHTNISLVLAQNGNHFERLIPVSDKDIEQTIDSVEAFKQNKYEIPINLKDTYNLNDNNIKIKSSITMLGIKRKEFL